MFERIYIELSDSCALECSFCPHSYNKTMRGVMELALFESLIAQIARDRLGKLVYLHILGDPLILKDLGAYLEILRVYKISANIVTSGRFLEDKNFSLLCGAPINQIAFSLSAFVDSSQSFKAGYLDKILKFCEFARKERSEVFVHLRLQDLHCENPLAREMLEQIKAFFGLKDFTFQTFSDRKSARLAYKTFLSITPHYEWNAGQDLVQNEQKSTQKGVVERLKIQKTFCYGLIKQFGILSSGVVVPCCIDCFGEIVLGDTKKDSLKKILSSPLVIQIAQSFKQGKALLPKCQNCGYVKTLFHS